MADHASITSAMRPATPSPAARAFKRSLAVILKYLRFIGPGAMVSVAYIDPGNYATDIAAGASYKFKLLFIVLVSNFIAIFLQSLAIKLGAVTGLNLAQMIRSHTHRYLNWFFYFFAEVAIVATDMAEVIGTAIALKILFHIPLVAGCVISIADVLFILLFYSPGNSIKSVRIFELLVFALVIAVVICFCYLLSLLQDTSVGTVLKGYLPSSAIVQRQGLYQSCGIVGATVMPHSLYLGSATIQARLLDYDQSQGLVPKSTLVSFEAVSRVKTSASSASTHSVAPDTYLPSLRAIRYGLKTAILELGVSLCIFALFVNSSILIVAGASLYSPPGTPASQDASNATLFAIHDLLSQRINPAAGALFGTALLLSGISAGIVCTIAGQIVSEGQIGWTIKPWQRRLLVRSIAIVPSVVIAGAVGEQGISTALEASQVCLCFCLPFCAAPLLWFTAFAKYQKVHVLPTGERVQSADTHELANSNPEPEEEPYAAIASGSTPYPSRSSGDIQPTVTTVHTDRGPVEKRAASVREIPVTDQSVTTVSMQNHWSISSFSLLIWAVLLIMNMAAVVMLGLGVGD